MHIILVVRQAGKRLGDNGRQLHKGHHRAKPGGEGDQHHHDGDGFNGAEQQDMQLVPFKVTIDKHCYEEGPDTGNRRRLRRGENTGQNPAHNDHHGEQAPERIKEDLQRLTKWDPLAFRVAAFMGKTEAHYHQTATQHQAR